jgi:hypothetical protein
VSGVELWTWAAIAVLVLVPPLIFVWFLFDAVAWLRSHPSRRQRRRARESDDSRR